MNSDDEKRAASRAALGIPDRCSQCQSFDLRPNFNGDRWTCYGCGKMMASAEAVHRYQRIIADDPPEGDIRSTAEQFVFPPDTTAVARRARESAKAEVDYLRLIVPVMRELGVQTYGSIMLATNAAEVANQVNEAMLAHLGGPRPAKKPTTKLRPVPLPPPGEGDT